MNHHDQSFYQLCKSCSVFSVIDAVDNSGLQRIYNVLIAVFENCAQDYAVSVISVYITAVICYSVLTAE